MALQRRSITVWIMAAGAFQLLGRLVEAAAEHKALAGKTGRIGILLDKSNGLEIGVARRLAMACAAHLN